MSSDETSGGARQPTANDSAGATRSRREFLVSTVPGLALTAAWPAVAASPSRVETAPSTPQHSLEDVLRRYGSEFGDLTRVS
jgi:hypothetical protein